MNLFQGDLHLWRYVYNEEDYGAEIRNPILSEEENRKHARFLNEDDAKRYICNHRFLRTVLGRYTATEPRDIILDRGSYGKPQLKTTELHFNLSYRKNYGLLAILKDREVGVDIEKIRELNDLSTFSDFSFTKEEKQSVFKNGDTDYNQLFTLWTFKEAVIKCTGTGLREDLSQMNLKDFFQDEFNPVSYFQGQNFTIRKIEATDGYKAAFAVKGEIKEHKEFNFREVFAADL